MNDARQESNSKLAVISNNVVGLFSSPDSSSEQVSQSVLGQPAWIEQEHGDWVYIKAWDGYHGWARKAWVLCSEYRPNAVVTSLFSNVLTEPDEASDIVTKVVVTTELEAQVVDDKWVRVTLPDQRIGFLLQSGMPRSSGSETPIMPRSSGSETPISFSCKTTSPLGPGSDIPAHLTEQISQLNKEVPAFNRQISTHHTAPPHPNPLPLGAREFPGAEQITDTAKRFIGTPYLWGGTTPFGIDCSGFSQLVLRINGIFLPRDAYMQAKDPRAIAIERDSILPGDLIFFARNEKITHVGIALGDDRFIHALGGGAGVVISRLDEERFESTYWGARRF